MPKPRVTLDFEEGFLYLSVVLKGELYTEKIELPHLGNKNEEYNFAQQIANLVMKTMFGLGYRQVTEGGIPLIK